MQSLVSNQNRTMVRIALGVVIGLLLIIPLTTQAQSVGESVAGYAGEALGYLAGLFSGPSLEFWYYLMLFARTVLNALLSIAAFFVNNVFYYNVVLNPANMPVVQEGWAILRDIANSLYILVILWIALTIVFNVEGLGGRKLLSRVIISALLVNFSLALTGAVFGIANQVAIPFRDAIAKQGDVVGLINKSVRLQTIFATQSAEDPSKLQAALNAQGQTRCGFSALTEEGHQSDKGCLGSSIVGSFSSNFFVALTESPAFAQTLEMALQVIFLAVLVATLVGVLLLLLGRVIAMVLLGIFAPAAFFAIGLPGGGGALWNKWLQKCLCWAFTAPIFYFLLFIAFKVLVTMTAIPALAAGTKNITTNILQMLPFFVFLVFVWVAIMSGKKLGCSGADGAIGLGRRLGSLGVTATAGVAATATGAALTVATGGAGAAAMGVGLLGRVAGGLAARRGIGFLARPVQRYATGYAARKGAELAKGVAAGAGRLGVLSPQQLIQGFRNTPVRIAPKRKAEYLHAILAKNLEGQLTPEESSQGGELARRFGFHPDFLKIRPDAATPQTVPGAKDIADAVYQAMRRLNQEEKLKISDRALRDEQKKPREDLMMALFRTSSTENLTAIGHTNQNMMAAMQEFLDSLEANTEALNRFIAEPKDGGVGQIKLEQFASYLAGNMAQGIGQQLGWKLPVILKPYVKAPARPGTAGGGTTP